MTSGEDCSLRTAASLLKETSRSSSLLPHPKDQTTPSGRRSPSNRARIIPRQHLDFESLGLSPKQHRCIAIVESALRRRGEIDSLHAIVPMPGERPIGPPKISKGQRRISDSNVIGVVVGVLITKEPIATARQLQLTVRAA